MSEADIPPIVLPEEVHNRILREDILPAWTRGAVSQDRPVAVFVAAQPGGGKTATSDLVETALASRGGAVRISSDLYKPNHPDYARLLREDEATAGVRTRPDTRRWQTEVEAYAREHRFDIVVETALADPAEFRDVARMYHGDEYRTEVAALAVPDALSWLGVQDRYVRQLQATGSGRMVSRENHDNCYHGMVDSLTSIDQESTADAVFVLRRGNHTLYSHTRVDEQPSRSAEALRAERIRPWDAIEVNRFRQAVQATEARIRTLPAERRPELVRQIDQVVQLASNLIPRTAPQRSPQAPQVAQPRLPLPAIPPRQQRGPRL